MSVYKIKQGTAVAIPIPCNGVWVAGGTISLAKIYKPGGAAGGVDISARTLTEKTLDASYSGYTISLLSGDVDTLGKNLVIIQMSVNDQMGPYSTFVLDIEANDLDSLGGKLDVIDTETDKIQAVKDKTALIPADPATETTLAIIPNAVWEADPAIGRTLDVMGNSAVADAVWASATRTLTSFGSLVADIATAVWGAAARTLTSLGTLLDALEAKIDLIKAKTDTIPTNPATEATLAAIDAIIDLIKAKTDTIPIDPATLTALAALDAVLDLVKERTDRLPDAPAAVSDVHVSESEDVTP